MQKIFLPLLAALCAFLSGCASIVEGGAKTVQISSEPPGAKLSIYDSKQKLIATQTTPTFITLRREQGYFSAANYRMVCEMPGYTSSEMQFKSTLNPWYLGNIVFGGLIGILIVDPATGAMWSFPSKELNFTLGSLGTSPEAIKASEGYAERLKNSLPVKSEQEATAKQ